MFTKYWNRNNPHKRLKAPPQFFLFLATTRWWWWWSHAWLLPCRRSSRLCFSYSQLFSAAPWVRGLWLRRVASVCCIRRVYVRSMTVQLETLGFLIMAVSWLVLLFILIKELLAVSLLRVISPSNLSFQDPLCFFLIEEVFSLLLSLSLSLLKHFLINIVFFSVSQVFESTKNGLPQYNSFFLGWLEIFFLSWLVCWEFNWLLIELTFLCSHVYFDSVSWTFSYFGKEVFDGSWKKNCLSDCFQKIDQF